MLIVFAFSVTPRKYLHDLVATHKDTFFNSTDGVLIFHKASVNCHTENVVAESPFANDAINITISGPLVFVKKQPPVIVSCLTVITCFSRLRGPPCLG